MVRLGHMQCMVEDSDESNENAGSNITFLYTLGPGTCPKSFGINVARLASLPSEVLTKAKEASEAFEKQTSNTQNDQASCKEKIMKAIEESNWEEVQKLWKDLQ